MVEPESAVRRLFAGIPWRNFTNNDIVEYEGYRASVFYDIFVSSTCEVIPEDTTNRGQVRSYGKAGGRSLKYLDEPDRRVFEMGMAFDRAARNLSSFAWVEW